MLVILVNKLANQKHSIAYLIHKYWVPQAPLEPACLRSPLAGGRAEKYCAQPPQYRTNHHAASCPAVSSLLPHHQPASARIQKIARALSNHRLPSREVAKSVLHAICTPPRSPAPAPNAPRRHITHFSFQSSTFLEASSVLSRDSRCAPTYSEAAVHAKAVPRALHDVSLSPRPS